MASWALLRGWVFSAWTTPATWAVDQLVSADDLNTLVRDNLNALKTPPSAHYECDEGSDYATNSTSFTDVDATHLALTITTAGGDVFVGFHGNVACNQRVFFDVYVDSARIGGDDGIIRNGSNGQNDPISFVRLVSGLSAGAHTFKLQWKVGGTSPSATLYAGAGTASFDVHPQFWVREMS
jgi:hypothetical protein